MKRLGTRVVELLLFATVPALLLVAGFVDAALRGPHHSDFWTFWSAGRDVLHGHSPYPLLHSLPDHAYRRFAPFVYPPVTAFSVVPLSLLPYAVAKLVFFALSVAAIGLAMHFLGVRDWRCYGAVYASGPAYAAVGLGAVGPFLLLGIAVAWHYRDRARLAGLAVAYVVTAKLFLWPLWFWLVRTRRFRAAGIAAAGGLGAVLASWAGIGFAGLREYPRLLARLTELVGPHGYSVYALERSLGVGNVAAGRSLYIIAFLALALVALFVRDDRRALIAVLTISLLATPILWPHYLVLLVVPIALTTRSLSPLWLMPAALWLDSAAWTGGPWWVASLLLAVCGTAAAAMWRRGAPTPHRFDPRPAV